MPHVKTNISFPELCAPPGPEKMPRAEFPRTQLRGFKNA